MIQPAIEYVGKAVELGAHPEAFTSDIRYSALQKEPAFRDALRRPVLAHEVAKGGATGGPARQAVAPLRRRLLVPLGRREPASHGYASLHRVRSRRRGSLRKFCKSDSRMLSKDNVPGDSRRRFTSLSRQASYVDRRLSARQLLARAFGHTLFSAFRADALFRLRFAIDLVARNFCLNHVSPASLRPLPSVSSRAPLSAELKGDTIMLRCTPIGRCSQRSDGDASAWSPSRPVPCCPTRPSRPSTWQARNWAPSFVSYLESSGLGTGGYAIPVGSSAQLQTLPWTNINQIRITFSEDVVVAAADLSVSGVNTTAYAFSGFSYDPNTYTATWTLDAPIAKDKLMLDLDANGMAPVQSVSTGEVLDGAWTDCQSTYPSGNGQGGTDFNSVSMSFRATPTPATASTATDAYLVGSESRQERRRAGYNIRYDVDGSGGITLRRLHHARRN